MRTAIEADKNGTPLRVFHAGGADGRYQWTHALSERKKCQACQRGTIPPDVLSGKRRSV